MPPSGYTKDQLVEWAKAEAQYVNNEKDQYLDSATHAGDQANVTSRTLSGQLLLISGAILTFSSAIIGGDSIVSKLSGDWKAALIVAWILLVLSAASGIGQIYSDRNFFVLWHKYNSDIAKELGTGKYNSSNIKDAINKFKKPKEASDSHLLTMQVRLLVVGIVLFLIVVAHLLFVPSTQTVAPQTVQQYTGRHYRFMGYTQAQ